VRVSTDMLLPGFIYLKCDRQAPPIDVPALRGAYPWSDAVRLSTSVVNGKCASRGPTCEEATLLDEFHAIARDTGMHATCAAVSASCEDRPVRLQPDSG
jgi:hypothetical protein